MPSPLGHIMRRFTNGLKYLPTISPAAEPRHATFAGSPISRAVSLLSREPGTTTPRPPERPRRAIPSVWPGSELADRGRTTAGPAPRTALLAAVGARPERVAGQVGGCAHLVVGAHPGGPGAPVDSLKQGLIHLELRVLLASRLADRTLLDAGLGLGRSRHGSKSGNGHQRRRQTH